MFDAVIAGQKQDLDFKPFNNFEQLFAYCYRVAGVVGLASIHIWGFEGGDDTEFLAVQRGVAFQLTNILRDLREDAFRGRIYLPRQELAMMQVSEDDLRQGNGGQTLPRPDAVPDRPRPRQLLRKIRRPGTCAQSATDSRPTRSSR